MNLNFLARFSQIFKNQITLNPIGAWLCLLWVLCVLSGKGLHDGLITRPEESYRLPCVVVCDLETSWMRRPWPKGAVAPKTNKQLTNLMHKILCIKLVNYWDKNTWNLSIESRVVRCGQTEGRTNITKLIVDFHFAKGPKNDLNIGITWLLAWVRGESTMSIKNLRSSQFRKTGKVGLDQSWINTHPFLHSLPSYFYLLLFNLITKYKILW